MLDIPALIDKSKIGSLQIGLFVLCGFCLIMDGFDVQAMGYVAPAIIQEWQINKASLGPVFGAGLFGMLVGSLVFSVIADKIGRRPVLIAATFFFSLCMLATPLVTSVNQLLLMRFITGMGLGCIMPNTMALAGEYSPYRLRVTIIMVVSCGFTMGAVLGGLVSAVLIPHFGWKAVFYVGGILPLLITFIMYFYLPESLQFLAIHNQKNKHTLQITTALKRINPSIQIDPDMHYDKSLVFKKSVPIFELFKNGRTTGTLLIWGINFMTLLNLYFLSNWLPTLIKDAGYSTTTAVLAGTLLQVGGVVGTLTLGRLIDKRGFVPVLVTSFLFAVFSIALIGQLSTSLTLLFIVIFIAGFCIVGGQPAVNAMSASYYPTSLRATGIGWGLGIGRIGSIIGPVLGGQLISQNWSSASLFLAAAVPAFISAMMILGMKKVDQIILKSTE
jgi:AAHS family 4-hydroxybenzoate transporter-like MFS transporter